MYIESDNIHIIALSQSLLVNVNVENCQNSGDVQCLNFFPNQINPEKPEDDIDAISNITLLYRPGHYDILYGNDF